MGTLTLALVCVVIALLLSIVLVFMELKRRKDTKLNRMWARLSGLDPDDMDKRWLQEWCELYRNYLPPRPGLLQRLWKLLGVE
jgi:hypothetical protein